MGCPLCNASRHAPFHDDTVREYRRCSNCGLIFVPEEFHLSPDEEKKRYDHHRNSSNDPEYRKFLKQLIDPLIPRLKGGRKGIDFGSGPGPALTVMLRESGFSMEAYDPFYSNYNDILQRKYDFLTSTETVEHFRRPRESWELMIDLVRPGGTMGIMTEIYKNGMDFSEWHYIRDATHVAFYSRQTFDWIADNYDLIADYCGTSVVIFDTKPCFSNFEERSQ